ncbi:hypothetical protein ACIGXM_20735 [Kitasatospora sp. NPDC052896]|uniref:hypothetical protein n=1 Tax=Kitasatospora sp. NPDC052896 TaxID=3364061 RepID=UPI0037C9459D
MPTTRTRRAHARRTAAAALGALLLTACGAHAPAAPAPSASVTDPTSDPNKAGFTVYDNSFYTNVDLEQYGATKSNVLYEGPVAALSGQNPGDFQDARKVELALPPQDAYERLVRQHDQNPGPLVLDFETLYLQGTPEVAQRHFQKLSTLLTWAHQAAPGKVIGFYGVLGNTAPQYYLLARQLAKDEGAFFPTLYTHTTDRTQWQTLLAKDAQEAKAIDPAKPVYAYLWPQYHPGIPEAGQYLPGDYWTFELDTARTYVNGVVIWSQQTPSTDQEWVSATQRFMSTLPHG